MFTSVGTREDQNTSTRSCFICGALFIDLLIAWHEQVMLSIGENKYAIK